VVALEPADGVAAAELLRLAASVQAGSEHLLARAVVDLARAQGVSPVPARDLRALPGRGIAATVENRDLRLGSERLMEELGVDLRPLAA
jgi:P-type Cu+ transporter